MMKQEIKTNSLSSILIAGLNTILFLGLVVGTVLILDLEWAVKDTWENNRELLYQFGFILIIGHLLLIESISRWTNITLRWLGSKLWKKKYIDGYPINEEDPGFKAVEADIIISKTSSSIQENNELSQWENHVWLQNMVLRYDGYNSKIKKKYRKLKRKYNRLKRLPRFLKLNKFIDRVNDAMSDNRKMLEINGQFINAINSKNTDDIINLNNTLDEELNINVVEYDHQILLDNEPSDMTELLEKIRNSKVYQMFINMLNIAVGIWILSVILKYTFDSGKVDSTDIAVIVFLGSYFATKVPFTVINALGTFNSRCKNKVKRSYIFRRYNDNKD